MEACVRPLGSCCHITTIIRQRKSFMCVLSIKVPIRKKVWKFIVCTSNIYVYSNWLTPLRRRGLFPWSLQRTFGRACNSSGQVYIFTPFLLTSNIWHNFKELSLTYYFSHGWRETVGCMLFSGVLTVCQLQTALFRSPCLFLKTISDIIVPFRI